MALMDSKDNNKLLAKRKIDAKRKTLLTLAREMKKQAEELFKEVAPYVGKDSYYQGKLSIAKEELLRIPGVVDMGIEYVEQACNA